MGADPRGYVTVSIGCSQFGGDEKADKAVLQVDKRNFGQDNKPDQVGLLVVAAVGRVEVAEGEAAVRANSISPCHPTRSLRSATFVIDVDRKVTGFRIVLRTTTRQVKRESDLYESRVSPDLSSRLLKRL